MSVDVNEFIAQLAKLAAQQPKIAKAKKPKRKSPKTPIPGTRYHGGALSSLDTARIMEMHSRGIGVAKIAVAVHRASRTVRKVIAANKQPVAAPVSAPVVEDVPGLGSIKRSMERLHDKTTALENKISSLSTRLNDVTAMVARVQQTVDKIVREFVTTNPPPAELIHPTVRTNGHIKE